jgi:hypothetical protein
VGPHQPLPIRDEQPPPDDWLVLRGGTNSLAVLRATIDRSRDIFGRLLVSVVVINEDQLHQALSSRALIGYRTVSFCMVSEVRNLGYLLAPTFRRPHYSIELPDTSDAKMHALVDMLSERMENPFYER